MAVRKILVWSFSHACRYFHGGSILDGADRRRQDAIFGEDKLKYRSYLGLPAVALALVLSACSGLSTRAASDYAEPPAWNSPAIMMMNTEIVSVEPVRHSAPNT
jgi:hypothetical protein